MKRFYFILMLMLCMTALSWGQTVEQPVVPEQQDTVKVEQPKTSLKQRITQRINDKLNEPYDTTRDKRYWWRAMKHGKINFKDSAMGYPKFVMFCYKTYMWGDRAFNSYDSAYVKPTGKNWKLFLKSNNWFDSYIGTPFKDMKVIMNSNLVSNIGVTLSFMAVSFMVAKCQTRSTSPSLALGLPPMPTTGRTRTISTSTMLTRRPTTIGTQSGCPESAARRWVSPPIISSTTGDMHKLQPTASQSIKSAVPAPSWQESACSISTSSSIQRRCPMRPMTISPCRPSCHASFITTIAYLWATATTGC